MSDFHQILKEYWGYDDFRPLQEEIIQSVASGKDTLGLMPTGGGKSITFQVFSMANEGLCLVVTPLIALMKDQVENLKKRRIKALAVYSGMTSMEIDVTLKNAVYGDYKFLYVSPERLASASFQDYLHRMKLNLITVDEAHCISQWGYDFRPSYLNIASLREHFPEIPILALTATATPDVVDDIQDKLQFAQKNVLQKSFYRENLVYMVRQSLGEGFKPLSDSVNVAISGYNFKMYGPVVKGRATLFKGYIQMYGPVVKGRATLFRVTFKCMGLW